MANKEIKNLRYWRRMAGLTQEQLAAKIKMSKGSINRLENDRQTPRPSTITAIASALSVPPESISW